MRILFCYGARIPAVNRRRSCGRWKGDARLVRLYACLPHRPLYPAARGRLSPTPLPPLTLMVGRCSPHCWSSSASGAEMKRR